MTDRASTPVFDIGGVLLDWDPRHLYRKIFSDVDEMEWFLSNVCDPAWNLSIDAGRTFDEAVAERTAAFPEWAKEIAAFRDRWLEMVASPIHGTVDLLQRLKMAGPVYAITNFGAESFEWSIRDYPFLNTFDGLVVSGQVRLIKPDPAIYHRLLSDCDLRAGDCLFIDDRPENVDAARQIGMHAVQFESPEQLEAVLVGHRLL